MAWGLDMSERFSSGTLNTIWISNQSKLTLATQLSRHHDAAMCIWTIFNLVIWRWHVYKNYRKPIHFFLTHWNSLVLSDVDMKRLIIWNLLIFKATNDEINHLNSKFITSLFGRENVQVLVNHFSRKIAKGVIESSIQGPVFLCNKMTQTALISFFPQTIDFYSMESLSLSSLSLSLWIEP